jgi:hypothetical protein
MTLNKAKHVAGAIKWYGDMTVNFHTAIQAASVLSKRVEFLEAKIARLNEVCEWQYRAEGVK